MRSALFLMFAAACQCQTLEQRLDRLLEAGPGKYFAGVEVYSLESKKILFKYNDDFLLMPASNMKILTTALALLRWVRITGSPRKFRENLPEVLCLPVAVIHSLLDACIHTRKIVVREHL